MILMVVVCAFMFLRNHRSQSWNGSVTDFEKEFLKMASSDPFWGRNKEIYVILSKMLSTCQQQRPMILTWQKKQFQMISFQQMYVRFKGQPMMTVERWGHTMSLEKAKEFLQRQIEETKKLSSSNSNKKKNDDANDDENAVEIISCSSEDVFRAMFEHIAATCRFRGEIDPISGLRVYVGHLSPQKV